MAEKIHVGLIAEGSYPYVAGGVSQWTHDLIRSLADIDFTIVAILPTPGALGEPKYPPLKNIRGILPVYLHSGELRKGSVSPEQHRRLAACHRAMRRDDVSSFAHDLVDLPGASLMRDEGAWDLLGALYREFAPQGTSFPDYFWTWRATHLPMFRVLQARVPDCTVLHALSTGFAGLLGAAERCRRKIPLLTTEHGIYAAERWLEILDADWIPEDPAESYLERTPVFKESWNRFFRTLSRIAYAQSDRIVTLYEGNRRNQIADGAPPEKTMVVPNGVDLSDYENGRTSDPRKFHFGLVGRVVPIKDVATFVHACKIVAERAPHLDVRMSIYGGTDEDEDYARRCRELTHVLGLGSSVTFHGRVDMKPVYRELDLVVLTSLREAQPLALLEAHACGIPAVTTDVGACRDLLEGMEPEDRALGPSGLITDLANPEATAQALIELAVDPERRRRMGEAGKSRVARFYTRKRAMDAYRELYENLSGAVRERRTQ